MTVLIIGLLIFLLVHLVPALAPGVKATFEERFGEIGFKGLFSLASIIGFALIIMGYGDARAVSGLLYTPPSWGWSVTAILMVVAGILFTSTYVSGRIAGAVKHPQYAAVKVWSFGHLLANGATASVLLFGAFLVWAVIGRASVKRRVRAGIARDNPGGPIRNDIIAIVLGIGLYVLFVMWAHEYLFGVSPVAAR